MKVTKPYSSLNHVAAINEKKVEHLGKNYVTTKPMTLTEIYNLEETEYKSEDKYSPIGFNNRY